MEHHAAHYAAYNADQGGIKALPALEPGDVSLAHAQNVVKAQLLFPLLHEKAVDIQQQHRGKDARDEHAHAHHDFHIFRAPHGVHPWVQHQGGHDVKGGGQADEGQQVRHKKPAVLADVLPGQLGVESVTHASHLRRSGGSGCQRSAGTSPHPPGLPGTAGGTPLRPG